MGICRNVIHGKLCYRPPKITKKVCVPPFAALFGVGGLWIKRSINMAANGQPINDMENGQPIYDIFLSIAVGAGGAALGYFVSFYYKGAGVWSYKPMKKPKNWVIIINVVKRTVMYNNILFVPPAHWAHWDPPLRDIRAHDICTVFRKSGIQKKLFLTQASFEHKVFQLR